MESDRIKKTKEKAQNRQILIMASCVYLGYRLGKWVNTNRAVVIFA